MVNEQPRDAERYHFDHPVDSSENARALGEASCTAWIPGFMRWAAPRTHDLEILLMAAHMDGFRAGLKATLPKSAAELKAERIAKWRAERIARTAKLDLIEGFGR